MLYQIQGAAVTYKF